MNFVNKFSNIINILHTIIKFMPLGVYFFTYLSSIIYKDVRSALLLGGLVINDVIQYLFNKYKNIGLDKIKSMKGGSINSAFDSFSLNSNRSNSNKLNSNKLNSNKLNSNKLNSNKLNSNRLNLNLPKNNFENTNRRNVGVGTNNLNNISNDSFVPDNLSQNTNGNCKINGVELPNSPIQTISFVASFYFSDMYYKQKLDYIPFVFILILVFLTIWSRLTNNCEKGKQVMLNCIFGIIRGLVYFYLVKNIYVKSDKNTDKCEKGFKNYQCNEILNGTVILK